MTDDEMGEIDDRLRAAYLRERVDSTEVQTAIRAAIDHRSKRVWLSRIAMAAAIICAAALSGYWAMRSRPEQKIFGDAARDHHAEVVLKAPRHWRTTDADLDTLTARFGISRERIAFSGYRLVRAKVCLLDGQRVLHLVYSDIGGIGEYSLYLMPDPSGFPVAESEHGAEKVAGFHANRLAGLVVGDGTARDCRRFTKTVTASL